MTRRARSPLLRLALAASLTITTLSVRADTLLIEAISKVPPNDPSGLLRPTNGQSMSMVLARFGEPREKLPAVGNPPITRWVYDEYTVYFEHQKVVSSAVHLGSSRQ